MSVKLIVLARIKPDDKWRKMKAVWDACDDACVEPPRAVGDFFDWEKPSEGGAIVDLVGDFGSARELSGDGETGYEIDLKHLPGGVTHIIAKIVW